MSISAFDNLSSRLQSHRGFWGIYMEIVWRNVKEWSEGLGKEYAGLIVGLELELGNFFHCNCCLKWLQWEIEIFTKRVKAKYCMEKNWWNWREMWHCNENKVSQNWVTDCLDLKIIEKKILSCMGGFDYSRNLGLHNRDSHACYLSRLNNAISMERTRRPTKKVLLPWLSMWDHDKFYFYKSPSPPSLIGDIVKHKTSIYYISPDWQRTWIQIVIQLVTFSWEVGRSRCKEVRPCYSGIESTARQFSGWKVSW